MMSRVDLRPAVRADFDVLLAEPLPYRVRAFTAVRDKEIVGIGGLAFLPDGTVAAFVRMPEGSRRYAVALHKAGLRTMAEARRLGIKRVVALADPDVKPARKWLARLGFQPIDVGGQEIWTWMA